ncbi:MAG: hypothetical protein KDK35_00530 [Leptospiraceae bacterium]|nr:hypothetical protein [Leptospiraceae bacterium]
MRLLRAGLYEEAIALQPGAGIPTEQLSSDPGLQKECRAINDAIYRELRSLQATLGKEILESNVERELARFRQEAESRENLWTKTPEHL